MSIIDDTYFIYKLLNFENKLLYIGKTKNIKQRIRQHFSERFKFKWKASIDKVYIAEVISDVDMEIYETYYINKLKPLHNLDKVYKDETSLILEELDFYEYKKEYNSNIRTASDGLIGKLYKIKLRFGNKGLTIDELQSFLNLNKASTYKFINSAKDLSLLVFEGGVINIIF